MGAWENSNDTLNLQHLRQQILAMQRAYDQVISPAAMAKTILDELQGIFFLIHMCIQGLGHFSPLPPHPPLPPTLPLNTQQKLFCPYF
jgi:hypothetical protein